MKKKIAILLSVILLIVGAVVTATVALAEDAEAQTITISYMKESNTTSDTTSLDTVAYTDGKQIVGVGESFTLPTTANDSYAGKEGFQLVWYTEDGRTYKAGETVSFDKDTKLFRCVAKECYTMTEVNYAMDNDSTAAILMADISTNSSITVRNQGQSVLILNGFTLNISKNGAIMGSQRSGKYIYGEGTINAVNPDGKLGNYYFFQDQSHGYNGHLNKTVIGRDVVINAPNFWMGNDGDGSSNNHYPWTRIYGTVNFYGFLTVGNLNNRAPFVEIFDTASVTISGPQLFKDNAWRANNKYSFNSQSFELRIYGGTFNLPAEAVNQSFWTNDYTENYVDGSVSYYNYGLDKNTADVIKIFGGTFNVAGGGMPAIADYLTVDFIGSIPSGGNGLVANSNDSTYHVAYMNRPGYKLVFAKYTEGTPAKLTVTDYIDGSLTGTYYYTTTKGTIVKTDSYDSKEITSNTIESIVVYNEDQTTVTDKFSLSFGMSGAVMFSNAIMQKDYKLQANGDSYLVVPAGCDHSYVETVVKATCQTQGSVTRTCSLCGHSTTTVTENKGTHVYTVVNDVVATLTTLGTKTFKCSECNETVEKIYTVDPSSLEIPVTIRNDDGTFENITALASDIFEFATSGIEGAYVYSVSAIKAFGDYNIRNIYGITIPKGILYVNITTHNVEKYQNVEYGLVNLTVAEGAKVEFSNIGNLRKIETIVVGKDADVLFGPSCSYFNPNNERRDMQKIATIDLSAGNHTVKFMSYAFESRKTITTLKLGENANYDFGYGCFRYCKIAELNLPATSSYVFEGESFRETSITTLKLPDGIDLTFGTNAFFKCTALTSVEFGENATYVIGSGCFRYSPIPKVVLAPNSTYTIGSQAFINTELTELDMSAGNMTVMFENSAFNCWLDNKLYCNLSTIKFGENSSYRINESSLNDVTFTSLKLAPNSSYTFKRFCINGTPNKTDFAEIDASADNITVVFEGEAFRDKKGLVSLKINGKNSSYQFNGSSFYATSITELVLGENSTYVFEGNAFNSSTPITSIDASAKGVNVNFKQNAFNGKSTLETLLINGENGTYIFGYESFKGVAVKALTLGAGSSYDFARYTFSNCKVESLDATASNVNAIFNQEAFRSMSALTYLAFGENSTYVIGNSAFNATNPVNDIVFSNTSTFEIGQEAFKDTDFASVKFEDNCNVTFKGNSAFYNCLAKELYIGKNITANNYPFRNFKYAEKITIMDGVVCNNEYYFENAGSADFATPLVVYNHSTDFAFNKGAFKNCDGIVLYTITENIGTRTDVFSDCSDGSNYKAWTVVLGIPHALVEGQADPTCTLNGGTIWVAADCGCGIEYREELNINVYENKHNIKVDTEPTRVDNYPVSPILALGHLQGEFVTIVYPNGYLSVGSALYNCERCMNAEGNYEKEVAPLMTCLGYSVSEFGDTMSITQGYSINVDAYNAYKEICPSLTYGIVAKVNVAGEAISPLTVSNGVIDVASGAYYADLAAVVDDYIDVKIKGISEKTMDSVIVLCAYIYDGTEIRYADSGVLSNTVVGISYNSALIQ